MDRDLGKKIASYLCELKRLPEAEYAKILSSDDLFRDGYLDSVLNLKLLFFLEKIINRKISPFHVIKRNFSNINAVLALVERLEKED